MYIVMAKLVYVGTIHIVYLLPAAILRSTAAPKTMPSAAGRKHQDAVWAFYSGFEAKTRTTLAGVKVHTFFPMLIAKTKRRLCKLHTTGPTRLLAVGGKWVVVSRVVGSPSPRRVARTSRLCPLP